jgi:hypothetical protein
MARVHACPEDAFAECAGGSAASASETVARLSEEERALCGTLEAAYDRLHALVRAPERDRLAAEAERARAIGARLEQVAARLNPLRADVAKDGPVLAALRAPWSETAEALQRIARRREEVLAAVGAAAADVRGRLVRLGMSRVAIVAYGKGWARERRRCARRA